MRYRNKITGEVIDTETGVSAAQSPMQTPTRGGGTNIDAVKQLLVMQGLGDIKNSSKYSTAFDLLDKLYPQAPQPTAEMRNRQAAIQPATEIIKELEKKDLPDLGYIGALTQPTLLKLFGGRMSSPEVQDLDSLYSNLRQIVLKAYQGGRMSDRDYAQALSYTRTLTDTPSYARKKLKNLRTILDRVGSDYTD